MEEKPYYIVPKCEKDIRIIYQDSHILLINKPEFLLTLPGRGPENSDSVLLIREQFPNAATLHRLDLDTSGILILSLTTEAHKGISRQFQNRQIGKQYEAVVDGIVEKNQGIISLPIAPDWENRPRCKICQENGKEAITKWYVIQRNINENKTRVLLEPITGRTHQLRIHTKEIGHPILGCDLYAPEPILARSPRLLLHACNLTFAHPITGKSFTCFSKAEF